VIRTGRDHVFAPSTRARHSPLRAGRIQTAYRPCESVRVRARTFPCRIRRTRVPAAAGATTPRRAMRWPNTMSGRRTFSVTVEDSASARTGSARARTTPAKSARRTG
jgi:hypothetical protein